MNEELEPVLQELWDMVQEALKFRKPGAENQGRSAHCFKSKTQMRVRVDNISMVKTGN